MKEKCHSVVWLRIVLLGVLGGPVAGAVFGAIYVAVYGFLVSPRSSVALSQTILFVLLGLVVGALVGLACGVCCSVVAAAGYLATRQLGTPVRASISGFLAGVGAVALSYLLIGPILSTFNSSVFAAVLGPTVGLGYFAVSFRRRRRTIG